MFVLTPLVFQAQTVPAGRSLASHDPAPFFAVQREPVRQLLSISNRMIPESDWVTQRVAPRVTPLIACIDMRFQDDLNILNAPSRRSVLHLLLALGAVMAINFLLMFWAVFLHRRMRQQTARIEHTLNLERERQRLLEAINSEVLPDQLLLSICRSIESLVPGLTCCCAVDGNAWNPKQISVGYAPERVLLEAPLTDAKGNLIGMFVAGGYDIDYLTAEEQESVLVGAGIANLAMNQRRLVDELTYWSTQDQLAELPNPRLSGISLDNVLQKAASSSQKIGVAFVDMQHPNSEAEAEV